MPAILLSQPAAERYGEQVRTTIAARPELRVETMPPGHGAEASRLAQVEAAFLSVDLMGDNSNPASNAPLRRYLEALLAAPSLKWLQLCSAGADRPQFRQLMDRGVQITTATGANARSVAHTAMAAALGMAREMPLWVRATAEKRWSPRRGADAPRDIDGARAVVLGMGAIGMEIGQLCSAFGMRVTGARRTVAPCEGWEAVVAFDRLGDALRDADFLFIACPLTEQTRGLVDAAMLSHLPRHARLVNVARGSVVVEEDLDAALREGRLAGAYADVFAIEPLPETSPLWSAPNFLVSAHSAGMSQGFEARTAAMFLDNLRRWVEGSPLRSQFGVSKTEP